MLNSITERAEFIFQEFGGLREARKVMSDNQIIDITLFNGLTATIFPFFKNFDTEDVDGYSYLNLYDAEYIDNTPIVLLDYNFNLLYRCYPSFLSVNGIEAYYFGKLEEENNFLKTLNHGSVCLLKYETNKSSNILQLIISHKLPNTIYKDSSLQWLNSINNQNSMHNTLNELILKLPDLDNIHVYTLKGSLSSNFTENSVVYHPNTDYNIYQNLESVYVNIETSLWMSLRHYKESTTNYSNLIGEDIDQTTTYLEGLGYTKLVFKDLGSRYNNSYIFHKNTLYGYVDEITVTVDDTLAVKNCVGQQFKVLTVSNITGERSNNITVNNDLALHISVTDLTTPITSGSTQPFITRRGHLDYKATNYAVSIHPIKCIGEVTNA